MHDLVVKGGTVVDGTGGPAFQADVAVNDGVITDVGTVSESGREEIDGHGLLVTPGFVDIHTHYDGQATWDPLLTSSCWHGVTTVVMGNCGVGFAPVRPGHHDDLIELMEGVEEIPGSILSEGIRWNWETFPEYLDYLDSLPFALDLAAQVPHGPLRAYVMGYERSVDAESSDDEIKQMTALVGEAIAAGAWGFTTSRTLLHRSSKGKFVPGTLASEKEIFAIGEAMVAAGGGTVENAQEGIVGEGDHPDEDTQQELEWMARLSRITGAPVVYTLQQNDRHPESFQRTLRLTRQLNSTGAQLLGLTSSRPIGAMVGVRIPGKGFNAVSYFNPLRFRPTYKALVELPPDEMVRRLHDPDTKAKILAEAPEYDDAALGGTLGANPLEVMKKTFPVADAVDYEPLAEQSIASLAAAEGRDPIEYFYDRLIANNGQSLFFIPLLNYSWGSHDALHEMLTSPDTVLGLGDGGAHVQNLCDASITTYLLTHWVRDRARGPRFPLELAVRKLTRDTAAAWGFGDRGTITPGLKGDLNVIDFDRLRLGSPRVTLDLPGGGQRIVQTSTGFVATINSGHVVFREGADTGARPGRLLRAHHHRKPT